MLGNLTVLILCDHNNPEYLDLKNSLEKTGVEVSRVSNAELHKITTADYLICFEEWSKTQYKKAVVGMAMDSKIQIVSPEYFKTLDLVVKTTPKRASIRDRIGKWFKALDSKLEPLMLNGNKTAKYSQK